MILNIVVYHIHQRVGIDETFNMFFISPYFPSTLPILSTIYQNVPYPIFLLAYLAAFVIGISAVFGLAYFISLKLGKKAKTQKESKSADVTQ